VSVRGEKGGRGGATGGGGGGERGGGGGGGRGEKGGRRRGLKEGKGGGFGGRKNINPLKITKKKTQGGGRETKKEGIDLENEGPSRRTSKDWYRIHRGKKFGRGPQIELHLKKGLNPGGEKGLWRVQKKSFESKQKNNEKGSKFRGGKKKNYGAVRERFNPKRTWEKETAQEGGHGGMQK